ncbi:unnamed protein product [Effrenium voratum]|nr:unnamed protein product [Effrenium voratum]
MVRSRLALLLLLAPLAFLGPRQPLARTRTQAQADQESREVVAIREKEEAERRAKRISGRLQGKPSPVKGQPEQPDNSAVKAALALAAALLLASALRGGDPGMPRDAYYISSSSYVIQSTRGGDGEVRTKVDENSGTWTNIPGLGQRNEAESNQRLRRAEAQLESSMQQMNQDMDLMFSQPFFGPPMLGLYGF